MGIVRGITGLLLAILVAVFAVANRQAVDVFWSPLHPAAQIPAYLLILGFLALGFVFGGLTVWFNTLPVRWEKRKQNKKIKTLEKELGMVKAAEKPIDVPLLTSEKQKTAGAP